MRRVRVTLDAGGREAEIHPMYDLLANAPFVDRATAMHWSYTDEAQAMLHFVEGDPEAFRAVTADTSAVLDVELVPAGEGAFYAFVRGEARDPLQELFGAIEAATVIPVPPVEYRPDGSVSFTILGRSGEIQAAIEAVPDPVRVTVEEVGGIAGAPGMAETRLSPRQREALEAALELGYYEIPRDADHEAVAAAMDCAPSTAAEHLRKAEATVIRAVVG